MPVRWNHVCVTVRGKAVADKAGQDAEEARKASEEPKRAAEIADKAADKATALQQLLCNS